MSFPQSATQAVFLHTELNTVGSMSAWICETSRRGTLSAYDTTFPWAADPATAIIEMQRSGYDRCTELIVFVTLIYPVIVILVLLQRACVRYYRLSCVDALVRMIGRVGHPPTSWSIVDWC
jgi:hypothetical protein